MSGPLSVPFAFLALFMESTGGKILFGVLAFLSALVASCSIWRRERQQVINARSTISSLQASLAGLAKRREIRNRLGVFSIEAKGFVDSISSLHGQTLGRDEILAWDRRVEEFLQEHLGIDYVARFKTGAGLPANPPPHFAIAWADDWHHVQTRLARLAEFMAELAERPNESKQGISE